MGRLTLEATDFFEAAMRGLLWEKGVRKKMCRWDRHSCLSRVKDRQECLSHHHCPPAKILSRSTQIYRGKAATNADFPAAAQVPQQRGLAEAILRAHGRRGRK